MIVTEQSWKLPRYYDVMIVLLPGELSKVEPSLLEPVEGFSNV